MSGTVCRCSLLVLAMACAADVHAQSTSIPIKPGLWQTTSNGTTSMALPPEQEARIAAMPAAQQAMIRSRLGGTPTTITTRSCAAEQTSVDQLLNQAQQKNSKCTLTNRMETSDGASFDISCVNPQGTASGHLGFHMVDSEHVTGTIHMTADASGKGGSMHMTIDNTMTSKYMGADCGTVKPGSAEVVQQ